MSVPEILDTLRSHADPLLAGALVRLGAPAESVLGVDLAVLEDIARPLLGDHSLAAELWNAGLRETRLLAVAVDDPSKVDRLQAAQWVAEADSVEVADYLATRLLEKTEVARELAPGWSLSEHELERRVGFVLMTRLSIDEGGHPDARFPGYFAPFAALDRPTGEAGNEAGAGRRRAGGFRAMVRFLGRRNRRQAWNAVQRAREAQVSLNSRRDR